MSHEGAVELAITFLLPRPLEEAEKLKLMAIRGEPSNENKKRP